MERSRPAGPGLRSTSQDRFQAVAVLGVGALIASGGVRGEVGRILIPVMPLLLVAGVAGQGASGTSGATPAGPSVGLSLVVGALLVATGLVIRLTWDVP